MTRRKQGRPASRPHVWAFALAAWLAPPAALACSTMAIGPSDASVFAYSYDTSATGAGYIVLNPAGATRTSVMEGSTARWRTLFGGISFNQMGPGMPTAGVNTAGLFASLMWNDAAVFPPIDDSDIVNEQELIQRVLDRAASVEEAVAIFEDANVRAMSRIQYFVADRTGLTAAIRPTAGGMAVHSGDDMPVRALTNSNYADLVDAVSAYAGFGGTAPLPSRAMSPNPGSVERFVLAASAGRNSEPAAILDGFAALVAVENAQTRWRIVVEPSGPAIAFRLAGRAGEWRIDMAELDFSCKPTPHGRSLRGLSSAEPSIRFGPVARDRLAKTLADVLEGFARTIGLPPTIAGPLAEAQIGALTCPNGTGG